MTQEETSESFASTMKIGARLVGAQSLRAFRHFRRKRRHRRRHRLGTGRAGRPFAAGFWITTTVLVVIGVIGVIWWNLWTVAGQASGSARVSARLDAARIALAAGGGAGAGIGLLLAFRRQRHHEIDAAEQRITELYVKAVEQLGAREAPVRLGGLHALARLGQENPGQQQTIVDLICAYLRMPVPVREPRGPSRAADEWTAARWKQEREVRITAQRVLSHHLGTPRTRDSYERFWRHISLDLNGAVLFDFDFHDCHLVDVNFTGAVFVGDARFDGTSFNNASFQGATFDAWASFVSVAFMGRASFSGSSFAGEASFTDASFDGLTYFRDVTFNRALFIRATFNSTTSFAGANFNGHTNFSSATFNWVDARVDARASMDKGSKWPPDWQLTPDPDGKGTFE